MSNTKQTIDFVGVSNQWEDQDKKKEKRINGVKVSITVSM